jgi:hypothetical protein
MLLDHCRTCMRGKPVKWIRKRMRFNKTGSTYDIEGVMVSKYCRTIFEQTLPYYTLRFFLICSNPPGVHNKVQGEAQVG